MERNIQRNGLVNLLVLLAAGVTGLVAARLADSVTGQVASVFVGLGVLSAAVSYFQMRLEARERLERLEFDEVTKTGASEGLFNAQESEAFPAQRAREQFEKWFVSGFTIVLFLLEAGGAFELWRWIHAAPPLTPAQPFLPLVLFGLTAFVLFLLGTYAANLVRLEKHRLLAPGASFLLLGCYLYFLAAVALVLEAWGGLAQIDGYLALALCLVLAVLAGETLIGLVLEVYRPRVKGRVARLLYDSRLIGLLSHPEGLFTTAAHALDYQFGFKVSETWFYQFLREKFGWILLAQFALLSVSTSLVFVEAGEEALLERFGRPVAGRDVLGPGLHFKWPWPVERAWRFRTDQIQNFTIGIVPDPAKEKEKTIVWTISHYKEEYNLLVARNTPGSITNTASGQKVPPVNLLSVSIPVQFQISDLRQWAYGHKDAGQLLEKIATREVVRYLVNVDLLDIMSRGRVAAAQTLRERIQAEADDKQLGARIVFVGLQDIHPPVKIASAYEDVTRAEHAKQAKILQAEAFRIATNALAGGEAHRKIREAESQQVRMGAGAQARAALFNQQLRAYEASPAVYAQRAYLQSFARATAGARKFVLASTNSQEVLQLNLEDKFRGDISEQLLGGATKGK